MRGPARYRITLQRVYATDEAISDGLRFHELRQFSLVIAKPDTMVVFSGCEWERLTERAEVGSSVLEEAVVLAAVRGEYEQPGGMSMQFRNFTWPNEPSSLRVTSRGARPCSRSRAAAGRCRTSARRRGP